MAGLGLFFRRRAISSDPVTNPLKDYVFYEKLKGDGTAYINTMYYPSSYDNFIVSFDQAGVSSMKLIMGARVSAASKQVFISAYNPFVARFYNNETPDIKLSSGINKVFLQLLPNANGLYRIEDILVEGVDHRTLSPRSSDLADYTLEQPLILFGAQTIGTSVIDSRIFNGSIMEVQVVDARSQEVKRLWRPCTYRGIPGMYEEIEGQFYHNTATSGVFTPTNRL